MTQPLPPPDGYDPISNIREKPSQQQNIQPSDHADDAVQHDEISRLSTSLLSLCKEVILSLREQATIPKDVRISLERSCSAMILWSDGYGIAQGNLNDIFKRSSKLRYTLFTNLSHLGRVLTERTYVHLLVVENIYQLTDIPPGGCRINTLGGYLIREAARVMFEC